MKLSNFNFELPKELYYEIEYSNPRLTVIGTISLIPSLRFEFALWYTINFYITVVGFTFEFLLLLALFSKILKNNSEIRRYYFLMNMIIILFDMTRFFVVADYRFVPSHFFTKSFAYALRSAHIIYGFFMCIFIPICQLALTMNRLTAVMIPLRHKKVRF